MTQSTQMKKKKAISFHNCDEKKKN